MDIEDHGIDKSLSLFNILFLEDSFDQTGLNNTLEEDPTSECNSLDNIQPITIQFTDILNTTESVSIIATDEINPHTNGNELPPIGSQTQTRINDSYADSDDEERPITVLSDGPQFDKIAKQLNNLFDDTDDYLSTELKSILNH